MAFEVILSTDSVKTTMLTALIYGDPGIGKTSVAFTTDNPILLDFDGGVQRACFRGTTIRVKTWAEVVEFQGSKEIRELKPATLIIDTAGGMLDSYIAAYVKTIDPKNARRGGELTLQGYGAMKNVFDQFKTWCKNLGINLIFIAHTTSQDEGDNTKFIPKVTGGSYDILRQECDLIGFLQSYQNKRIIDFNPADAHIGKNCAEIPRTEIPHYTDPSFPKFFQSLIDSTLNKMNALNDKQTESLKKIDTVRASISEAVPGEAYKLNEAFAEISKDADRPFKIQAFNLMKAKAAEIGAKFNDKTKLFEDN